MVPAAATALATGATGTHTLRIADVPAGLGSVFDAPSRWVQPATLGAGAEREQAPTPHQRFARDVVAADQVGEFAVQRSPGWIEKVDGRTRAGSEVFGYCHDSPPAMFSRCSRVDKAGRRICSIHAAKLSPVFW